MRAGGRPSAALQHRIDGALLWARKHHNAVIMPTGGVGDAGPSEAVAMKHVLVASGIKASRIVLELTGRDTLESVRRCDAILRKRGDCGRVVICTSTYHQLRCAMLFRLLGYRAITPKVPNSMDRLSRASYAKLLVKELIATPYDSALLIFLRARGG
ncbi:MAG: YdcF family protein [Pseudomonadota bacterium]|nr:YdcF family protein [Pseudomonadota bacterium]